MTKVQPISSEILGDTDRHVGVMSGLIGADNRFGRDFHNPDDNLQGDIVGLYDVRNFRTHLHINAFKI